MSIEDHYNQSFKWSTQVGKNDFGDHTFANDVVIKGRLQLKKVNTPTPEGEVTIADGILYTGKEHALKINDRIEYEDSVGVNKTFGIVDIYEAYDKDSLHHKKVTLKYAIV